MSRWRLWKGIIIALSAFLRVGCADATPLPEIILGDYNAELRGPDNRVDIPLMIQRLKDMQANTFFWLIWHAPTDWEDLQRFLPEAQKAQIQVWAYLCPHSEQGGQWPYSEPFRLDFVKWAEEIARLSLKYPNLVGWIIDDFWANFGAHALSPALIRQMQQRAKEINPELRFYPLMYFKEIGPRFATELAPLVDGVVAAYHQNKEEIQKILPYLDDRYTIPARLLVSFPRSTKSHPGDQGMALQAAEVVPGQAVKIRFKYKDNYDGPTTGYHLIQLRVDDEIVWQEDIAGVDEGIAEIDLSQQTAHKQQITLALGLYDIKGVSEYAVTAEFYDLSTQGLRFKADFGQQEAWRHRIVGPFQISHSPAYIGQHRYKLPLIVMPAGSRGEYKHRYNEEATPERIAARTRQALELVGDGRVIGTVIYCLDKKPGSPDLEAIRDLYKEFRKPNH